MDKKHPCPDCKMCQWCSDDRCRLCLRASTGCRRKLSMAEQIELYEKINAGGGPTPDNTQQDQACCRNFQCR